MSKKNVWICANCNSKASDDNPVHAVKDGGPNLCWDCYESMTCVECEHRDNCKFAYDLYNLNGDCLAEK